MNHITGGCLCGNVRYSIAELPTGVFLCYCRQCQKAQGTPFVATVPVAAADFRLIEGANSLKAYRASPHKARYFCGDCGSPIYSQVDGNAMVRIRAGSLDNAADLTIRAHIYTADKVAWYEITGVQPQHAAREPDRA
jgi:hypothetical protein